MNAAVFDCFATKNTDFHRAHLALRATDAHACKKQSMTVFYFSPCGSTRSYAETAAQVLREAGHAVACMDLTEGGSKTARCGGALCFLCCPVYEAGAPALFLERLATLELRFESAALLFDAIVRIHGGEKTQDPRFCVRGDGKRRGGEERQNRTRRAPRARRAVRRAVSGALFPAARHRSCQMRPLRRV